jgi:AcrR family transcriptional regulator
VVKNLSGRSDRTEAPPPPLSFTEQARRRQILTAVIELLADGGYQSASLAAIAARIGASKGVVSYHFDGKDELLAHVVTTVLSDAAAYMTPRILAVADAQDRVRAYVSGNLDYLDQHRTEARALTAVLAGLPPDADGAPAYAAANREAVAALAILLRDAQNSGQFRTFDVQVVARSLRASIDAVTELLRADPDIDIGAYGQELTALFERGVQA